MKMRPSLPSAVAYLALAGLVAETRLELFALRKSDAHRRGLEQSDADVLSAELLEKELEKLRAEGRAADERLTMMIHGVTREMRTLNDQLGGLRADVDELRPRRKRRRRRRAQNAQTCADAQTWAIVVEQKTAAVGMHVFDSSRSPVTTLAKARKYAHPHLQHAVILIVLVVLVVVTVVKVAVLLLVR